MERQEIPLLGNFVKTILDKHLVGEFFLSFKHQRECQNRDCTEKLQMKKEVEQRRKVFGGSGGENGG